MTSPAGLLVFVEVKTRRKRPGFDGSYDATFETINWRKRRKILITVQSYLARTRPVCSACRIDVLVVRYRTIYTVDGALKLSGVEFDHVEDAFSRV